MLVPLFLCDNSERLKDYATTTVLSESSDLFLNQLTACGTSLMHTRKCLAREVVMILLLHVLYLTRQEWQALTPHDCPYLGGFHGSISSCALRSRRPSGAQMVLAGLLVLWPFCVPVRTVPAFMGAQIWSMKPGQESFAIAPCPCQSICVY